MILIISLITFLSSYFFHLFYWRRRLLPPGPIPFPFIGNLYLMRSTMKPGYKVWKNLSDKYGPVYTFWMAHIPFVIVTDWQLIRDTFIKDGKNYAGRPQIPFIVQLRKGNNGIIDAFGEKWKKQKAFAMGVLKNVVMKDKMMENEINEETEKLIRNVRNEQFKCGKVDLRNFFDMAVGSILSHLLFGYGYDDTNSEELEILKNRIARQLEFLSEPVGRMICACPWLGYFPYFSSYKDYIKHNWNSIMEIFRWRITEKSKNMDSESGFVDQILMETNSENETKGLDLGRIAEKLKIADELKTIIDGENESSDFVDAFLKERKKHVDEPGYGGFEMDQLESVCLDLWICGMETISSTLYWAVLYVLLNSDVKRNIQVELNEKVGSDRIITTSDRRELNYVCATINEAQRLANLLPMNMSHLTMDNVEIGGFKIPKGSIVIPQISQLLYDETVFPEPEKFKPERFLDTEGKMIHIDQFVPFSIGERQCMGEQLAKMKLFLIFANIFNQLEISLDPTNLMPSVEKDFGATMKANTYYVNIKPRF